MVIGAVATILGGVWFIIRQAFNSGMDANRLKAVEEKNQKLPCDRHNQDLILIKSILIGKDSKYSSIFAIKQSPRQLSEMGKRLYDDIKGEQFLAENKDFFFKKISESNPQTALDVEMICNYVCMSSLSESIFNSIKDYVYNAPSLKIKDSDNKEVTYDLSLRDVCFVLSIPLRDMYLNDHKEIKS